MSQEDLNYEIIEANFEFVERTPIEATFTINATTGDMSYTHHQDVAQDTWIIEHNLNKCPSVTITTSAGEKIEADVQYKNMNIVEVSFVGAFAGVAYLN